MPDSNDRTQLSDLLKDLRGNGIKEAVALLGLLQTLKEEAGVASGPPLGADVLFQLAKLQMSTISQLAQIGTDGTSKLVDLLKQRREARRSGQPAAQALVTIAPASPSPGGEEQAEFSVKNPSTSARSYPLPDFVHLEEVTEKKGEEGADYYLPIAFFEDEAKGQALSTLEIPGKAGPDGAPGQVTATLVVTGCQRLGQGRHYRGRVRFEAEGSPALELIVELFRSP
jgi:hypothetical protein